MTVDTSFGSRGRVVELKKSDHSARPLVWVAYRETMTGSAVRRWSHFRPSALPCLKKTGTLGFLWPDSWRAGSAQLT